MLQPHSSESLDGPHVMLRQDAAALTALAAATLAVELGVCLLAVAMGLPGRSAALAALAACCVWVSLAAPIGAAGGRGAFGALLRAGMVADATAVTLLVLWLAVEELSFSAVAGVYLTLAAVALAGAAAARIGRCRAGRYAFAMGLAVLLMAALASPFWCGGLLAALEGEARTAAAHAVVYANPFFSVSSAVAADLDFVWHQSGILYDITRLGDYAAAPPLPWYTATLVYGVLALVLGIVAAIVPKRSVTARPTGAWRRDCEGADGEGGKQGPSA